MTIDKVAMCGKSNYVKVFVCELIANNHGMVCVRHIFLLRNDESTLYDSAENRIYHQSFVTWSERAWLSSVITALWNVDSLSFCPLFFDGSWFFSPEFAFWWQNILVAAPPLFIWKVLNVSRFTQPFDNSIFIIIIRGFPMGHFHVPRVMCNGVHSNRKAFNGQ